MSDLNIRDENADEQAFRAWKAKVNAACESICGMSTDDLEDQPYWDWFTDGVPPATAARRAIRYAGGSDLL